MTRPALHDRLALLALGAGLPAVVVALLLLADVVEGPLLFWLTAAGIVAPWLVGALILRSRFVYRLGTAANLVNALRQGDLSIRARHGWKDGGYGSLIVELNAVGVVDILCQPP